MKRHALFVGINYYKDRSIRKLRYSITDASVLADRFKGLGYETWLLSDPTRAQLQDAVQDSVEGLVRGDLFLFFFAGHGFTAQDGSHLLFCNDDDHRLLRVDGAGVKVDALEELTNDSGCNRIFMLDACRTDVFAGSDSRGATRRDLAFVSLPDAKVRPGTYCVLRSCDKFCPALEIDGLGHGVFTQAVLDIVGDDTERGLPVGDEFVGALRSRMHSILKNYEISEDQNPDFQTNGSPFLLFDSDYIRPAPSAPAQPAPGAFGVPSVVKMVKCPICGRRHREDSEDIFECQVCHRDFLCIGHFDEERNACGDCASKAREEVTHKAGNNTEVAMPKRQGIVELAMKSAPLQPIKNFNVGAKKKTIRYMLTAFSDGFQIAMCARVQSKHFLPAVEAAYDAGVRWFEIGGGAFFRQSFLSCQENAFDVMDSFRRLCPDAELQALSRGLNIVGIDSQPTDIIRLYANLFKKHGINAIRNYDALYDPDNLKTPAQCIHEAGMHHELAIGIIGVPPGMHLEYAHSPEFYAERLKICLESGMPIDRVCFMDNSGTASPNVVFTTISKARRLLGDSIHIQFHTHDSVGMGLESCMAALKGGADGLDLSFAPLSGGLCQPDLIAMYQKLRGSDEFDLDLNLPRINVALREFKAATEMYYIPAEHLGENRHLINIPVPGGALLATQMFFNDNGVDFQYEKLASEFAECFTKGGCAAPVTPASNFYMAQATHNILLGKSKSLTTGYAKLLLGYFGRLPVKPDSLLVERAIESLASDTRTRAYARITSRPCIELNDADSNKGIDPARRILEKNRLLVTDENILISATCRDEGIKFLKGEGVLGCRFANCGKVNK